MLPYMFLLPLSLFALRQAPAGTELHVRLVTPVGSYASRAGDPVGGSEPPRAISISRTCGTASQ